MTDVEITMPAGGWRARPHQVKALRALSGGCRRAILNWHRRAGKDAAVVNWCATEMVKRPTSVLYLLPEFKQAKRVLFREIDPHTGKSHIKQAYPERLVTQLNESEGFFRLWNGSILQVGGFDSVDSYVGIGPKVVVLSEWATSPYGPRAWNLLLPMLLANSGTAIFPSTPRGKNHYKELIDGVADDPAWFYERLTVEDTGLVPLEEIKAEVDSASMTEEYARQEFWCFPPDAPVLTARGLVPISAVQVGDCVLTHANRWRPVERTMVRPHRGELVRIGSYGNDDPIVCTPEHPIRVRDRATRTYRWVSAGDISVGDLVTFPRPSPGLPLIPAALAKLIAWYLTEGAVSKNGVQFTLYLSEEDYRQDIVEAAAELGLDVRVDLKHPKGKKLVNLRIRDGRLADFLASHCGIGARGKRLPLQLIGGHEQAVFERLLWGDGRQEKDGNRLWSYGTASRSLAYEVQALAHTLGYKASVAEQTPGSWLVRTADGLGDNFRTAKRAIAARVTSVERVPCDGYVHNLKVKQDESYTAYGRVVHNCSFETPTAARTTAGRSRSWRMPARSPTWPGSPRCRSTPAGTSASTTRPASGSSSRTRAGGSTSSTITRQMGTVWRIISTS